MLKKYLPLYLVVLLIASLAMINGCGSGATSGGGGGGGGSSFSTISITITPEGTGTVDAVPGFACVTGTTVELTATPTNASTHVFGSWEGDFVGLTSPLNLYVNGNKKITAVFRPIDISKYYDLTIATDSGGTTSPAPGTSSYVEGTVVVVTAEAAPGSVFDSWSGDQSGTKETTSITMNASKEISAHFKALHILSVSVTPEGSGTVEPFGGGIYKEGTIVHITAEANSGYAFSSWSGDVTGTARTTIVTMDSDKAVTATFISIPHTYYGVFTGLYNLTVPGGGAGSGGLACLSVAVITSDASLANPKTFYVNSLASLPGLPINGTWEALSDGFSQVDSATPSANKYFYENILAGVGFSADTNGTSAEIWAVAATTEPNCSSGDTWNVMQFRNAEDYDYFEVTNMPSYSRFTIHGSNGSYPLSFSGYNFDGSLFIGPQSLTLSYRDNKYMYWGNPSWNQYGRYFLSPSNILIGSQGSDTQENNGGGSYSSLYDFFVGGKAYTYSSNELSGREFVGLLIGSPGAMYIAGEGDSSNQINFSHITTPATSSNYSDYTQMGTITLGTQMQAGVLSGSVSIIDPSPLGPYLCDTIVTKVGNSDKYMVCGIVSMEGTGSYGGHDQYKSANFFLIEK